ncbi:MAG: 16S rRNA (adenine(1518)-N(6)/adenine(1519)-N(6))-dimethyltransferase RsmA [Candidatus Acidiferrales bacterium]
MKRGRRPPLGQHFLRDPGARQKILYFLKCRPEDGWLEIGAGHGEMTLLLAGTGARVVGVERDARLAAELRPQLAALANVQLLEADILKVSLEALAQEHGVERWRVYGNLPYYITSPILHQLFQARTVVGDIHIVIQREVAERLCAAPGNRDYGYLSVATQFYTQPEILMAVPRGAFRPPPKVESSLVRLVPPGKSAALGIEDDAAFLRFVQACFRQKRRTLRANLRARYGARVEKALAALELAPRARAEELWLEQLAALYRALC